MDFGDWSRAESNEIPDTIQQIRDQVTAVNYRVNQDRYNDHQNFQAIRNDLTTLRLTKAVINNTSDIQNTVAVIQQQVSLLGSEVHKLQTTDLWRTVSSISESISALSHRVDLLHSENERHETALTSYFDKERQDTHVNKIVRVKNEIDVLNARKNAIAAIKDVETSLYNLYTYGQFEPSLRIDPTLSLSHQDLSLYWAFNDVRFIVVHVNVFFREGDITIPDVCAIRWNIDDEQTIHINLKTTDSPSTTTSCYAEYDGIYTNYSVLCRFTQSQQNSNIYNVELRILKYTDVAVLVTRDISHSEFLEAITMSTLRCPDITSFGNILNQALAAQSYDIHICRGYQSDSSALSAVFSTIYDVSHSLYLLSMEMCDAKYLNEAQTIVSETDDLTSLFTNSITQILHMVNRLYADSPMKITKSVITSPHVSGGDIISLNFRPTFRGNNVRVPLIAHNQNNIKIDNTSVSTYLTLSFSEAINIGSGSSRTYSFVEQGLYPGILPTPIHVKFSNIILIDESSCQFLMATVGGKKWNEAWEIEHYDVDPTDDQVKRSHTSVDLGITDQYLSLLVDLEANESHILIEIYPTDAVPSVGSINQYTTAITNYVNEGKRVSNSISITWSVKNVAEDGVIRFVIEGRIPLRQITPRPRLMVKMCPILCVDPFATHLIAKPIYDSLSRETHSQNTVILDYNVGELGLTTDVQHVITENAKTIAGIKVARMMPTLLNFHLHLKTINYVVMPSGKDFFKSAQVTKWHPCTILTVRGFVKKDDLTITVNREMIKCSYLRDPTGSGRVSQIDIDFAKHRKLTHDIGIEVDSMNKVILNLESRLDYVDMAISRMSLPVSGTAATLGSLSMVVSIINPIAGMAMAMTSAVLSVSEMSVNGISLESVTIITTELLTTLVAIKRYLNKNPHFIKQSSMINNDTPHDLKKKYDAIRIAASGAIQRVRQAIHNIKYKPLHSEDIPLNGLLKNFEVEHMYRPMRMFDNKTTYFTKLTQKVVDGSASSFEKSVFKTASAGRVYPAHQLMRLSNFETSHDNVFKNVWIYGISDGFASSSSARLIGNHKTQFIKLSGMDGAFIGPGVWKLRLKKTDEGWDIMPYRESGMTPEEVLVAGGLTPDSARQYVIDTDSSILNPRVEYLYAQVSKSLITDYDHYVTKTFPTTLMDGQLNALTDAIKSPENGFKYALIGNNCQNFVSSITKLLNDPSKKPAWMSHTVYKNYLSALDDGFSEFT